MLLANRRKSLANKDAYVFALGRRHPLYGTLNANGGFSRIFVLLNLSLILWQQGEGRGHTSSSGGIPLVGPKGVLPSSDRGEKGFVRVRHQQRQLS